MHTCFQQLYAEVTKEMQEEIDSFEKKSNQKFPRQNKQQQQQQNFQQRQRGGQFRQPNPRLDGLLLDS